MSWKMFRIYSGITIVMIVFSFVFIMTTYLSRLSLTADFDGDDRKKLIRLQFVLNSIVANKNYKYVDTTFYKALDSLRREAIFRDYEKRVVKIDSAFFAENLLKSPKRKAHNFIMLKSYVTYLQEMIDLRERPVIGYTFDFWMRYFRILDNHLEHNDVMSILTNILIAPLLYLIVIVLTGVASGFIIVRYLHKYFTAKYLEKITDALFEQNGPNQNTLLSLGKKMDALWRPFRVGVGVFEFTKVIGSHRYVTSEKLEMLLFEDDNETEKYHRVIDFINAWILRIGILGTLVGIMLAFYEVAEAVPSIEANSIPIDFKQKIKEALTGHAVSVITALASQGTSVLLEMTAIIWVGNSLSKDWLIRMSKIFMEKSLDVQQQFNLLFKELRESIAELNKQVASMTGKFSTANGQLKDLSVESEKIIVETKRVVEETSHFVEETKRVVTAQKNVTESTKRVNDETKRVIDEIKSVGDSSSRLKDELENTESAAVRIQEIAQKMEKSFTSANDALGTFTETLKQTKNQLKSVWENVKKGIDNLVGIFDRK